MQILPLRFIRKSTLFGFGGVGLNNATYQDMEIRTKYMSQDLHSPINTPPQQQDLSIFPDQILLLLSSGQVRIMA